MKKIITTVKVLSERCNKTLKRGRVLHIERPRHQKKPFLIKLHLKFIARST